MKRERSDRRRERKFVPGRKVKLDSQRRREVQRKAEELISFGSLGLWEGVCQKSAGRNTIYARRDFVWWSVG